MERLYCPYLMAEDRPRDAAGWKAFGARLQKAGAPYGRRAWGLAGTTMTSNSWRWPMGRSRKTGFSKAGPDLEWEIDVAWVIQGRRRSAGLDRALQGPDHGGACEGHRARGAESADEDGWCRCGARDRELEVTSWPRCAGSGSSIFVMEHDNPRTMWRFATPLDRFAQAF